MNAIAVAGAVAGTSLATELLADAADTGTINPMPISAAPGHAAADVVRMRCPFDGWAIAAKSPRPISVRPVENLTYLG